MDRLGSRDDRILLRIGEVARRAGVRTDTLRYYERLGLVEPTTRSSGGYRLYDAGTFERLSFVRKAQALGLTLQEVGEILHAALEGSPPCDHVREMLSTRLDDVDERISELQALRRTLVGALDRSRELPLVAGCLCGIIESQELPPSRISTTSGAPRARS